MSLAAILDALAAQLADALGDGVHVGDVSPSGASGLPAVTMSLDNVTTHLVGVGSIPRGTRIGALPVEIEVDLANPTLDLGGGETLTLLSGDRRTITLPNGPLVRADGVADPPYADGDLHVVNGGTWTVVAGIPAAGQLRPDPVQGVLVFGTALPASGTLSVRHHVGQWDVVVSRFQGELGLAVAAATPDVVRTLSRQVATTLDQPNSAARLVPLSWGAASAVKLGDSNAGPEAHVRLVGYRFDAELEEPVLPSGGGVIARVAIDLHHDDAVESFAVARERSPA